MLDRAFDDIATNPRKLAPKDGYEKVEAMLDHIVDLVEKKAAAIAAAEEAQTAAE